MNKNETIQFIQRALDTLWVRDERLIVREVKEEVINHRLAKYLEDELQGINLHVDLEYDSDGERKKRIRIRNRYRKIRPDVILHERESNSQNYLAIESKINMTSAHDRDKLIGLLQSPYNYRYGAAISYLPKKNYFRVLFFYKHLNSIWEQEFYFSKEY